MFNNTSGVTATSIQRHVNNITKGLTPRIKQLASLDVLMPKDTEMDTGVELRTEGTDILYARPDHDIKILKDKGETTRALLVPKLQLPTKDKETTFYSPREDGPYEETRETFMTTLETSPPTPGFGKDRHHPQTDNMKLRLDTIQEVELVQLACPYCGIVKTTKQAIRAHYTTAHQGLYRPPADDPCYCVGCRRVMTKPYYRDHRCRNSKQAEFERASCVGCGVEYSNPQLSAHLIHCVKYEGQLTPQKQNTGAFEFAKRLREMLRPSLTRPKAAPELPTTTADPTLMRAKSSLRPHTPRGMQTSSGVQPPTVQGKDRTNEVETMRRQTEAAIRREQSRCDTCNKELKSSQALRRHEALYHPNTERPKGLPVYCIGCNTTFKTAATYVKHKCLGTLDQELAKKQCPLCDADPISNPDYSVHMLKHQIIETDGRTTPRDLYDPQ
ncbi:hypothetical protein GNI_203430 [Gregarina niphandrodes]|uniref:C2H2-type domain-containing protein n=1 Tax=Gregarina niphandrodes TaxID=110365 RepID=A0A023AX10_GRENI|nr:hypothetical protein GNI_203430 [Gregarina niphandrodes]EZG42958.1 hypothetical protein GNI_203430 [Gregarina niphandrodes]|eukprot:XP_011133769.1 hypothetical protein GNI_203430 [Gregarina niphandrodes]